MSQSEPVSVLFRHFHFVVEIPNPSIWQVKKPTNQICVFHLHSVSHSDFPHFPHLFLIVQGNEGPLRTLVEGRQQLPFQAGAVIGFGPPPQTGNGLLSEVDPKKDGGWLVTQNSMDFRWFSTDLWFWCGLKWCKKWILDGLGYFCDKIEYDPFFQLVKFQSSPTPKSSWSLPKCAIGGKYKIGRIFFKKK